MFGVEIKNVDRAVVEKLFEPRPKDMHKGTAGNILIVAGQKGMTGAAVLAAKGALRSGAGLVRVALPESLFNIVQISVSEAICIDRSKLNADELDKYDAIAVGPGLGVSETSYEIVKMIVKKYHGPLVIDADGLNCLAEFGMKPLMDRKYPAVITPHPGEAKRIMAALKLGDYDADSRTEIAESIAAATGAVTLLKGRETVTSYDNVCMVNKSGNSGMATAGSGDVLTGVITALLGNNYLNLSEFDAAYTGAYIHGRAGDFAAEKYGKTSMLAGDIADSLCEVFKTLE